jgi:membrane protein
MPAKSAARGDFRWHRIVWSAFNDAFWHDNCLGMSAQLAYYFFFSLFPALLFLLAIASYFPFARLVDQIVTTLGGFAPPDVIAIVTDQIKKISNGDQGGLLTLGMLVTLWTSSTAMTAVINTVNRAYDIDDQRAWWKIRLLAIALTIGASLFILISFALVTVGPELAGHVADWVHLGAVFRSVWVVLQWPIVFALVSLGVALIYHFAPDADQPWVWLTPGALFATLLWIATSVGFRYYVVLVGSYTRTYGVIGGVMVLLLWFYLSGLAVLLGAELNAEIEHARGERHHRGRRQLELPSVTQSGQTSQA